MLQAEQKLTAHYLDLLDAARKNWETAPVGANLRDYITNYDWCVSMLTVPGSDAPREYIRRAFEHLPTMCKAVLAGHRDLPVDLSDHILDLLVDPAYESILDTLEHKDATLAWFCGDHCVLYVDDHDEKAARKFRQLLRNWTGRTISEDTEPKPAFVMALLYGDACWDLYGSDGIGEDIDADVEDAALCVRNITIQGLPLAFRQQPSVASPEMPATIFE